MKPALRVIILAGGSGSRLYPLSRESFPKQFLKIFEKSTLEKSLDRAKKITDCDSIIISTRYGYRFIVEDLIKEKVHILEEPSAKNTAASALYSLFAATEVYQWRPDDIYIFMPSDHEIWPEEKLIKSLKKAANLAQAGYIVALGVTPQNPEPQYGYLELGEKRENHFPVVSFEEKPDREKAEELIAKGSLWNSGIYVTEGKNFLNELLKLNPEFSCCPELSFENLKKHYDDLPSFSIEDAITKKTEKLVAIKGDFTLYDIGTWDAVYTISKKDKDGNVKRGKVLSIKSKNSLIMGEERVVVTYCIQDLLIIETPDVVFVGKRGNSPYEEEVICQLEKKGFKEAKEHVTVHRPWGHYTVLIDAPKYKVKKIYIKPGKRLSLQYHRYRAEHWIVVKGKAKVTLGDREIILKENESTFVPKLLKHRLENICEEPLEIIEVQTGDYLEEDDIVRIENDWARS